MRLPLATCIAALLLLPAVASAEVPEDAVWSEDYIVTPGQPTLHVGVLGRLGDLLMQAGDDRLRRARGREKAIPAAHLHVGEARLPHGRDVGQDGNAARRQRPHGLQGA